MLKCGLKHHTRRGDRSYPRWQQASDLVTLPLLREAKVIDAKQAADGLFMSIEKAYDQLPEPPEDEGGAAPDAGDQDGEPSFDPGMGEVMDSPARDEQEREDSAGAGAGDGKGEPQNGGASDGDAEGSGEPDGEQPGGSGQATSDPVQAEEQEWDERMQQAMQWSKAQGSMPGAIQQTIERAHFSEVDWREELQRFMRERAPVDLTWNRPNRRFIEAGLYLPSMDGESMDTLVFAIDTSGSMSERALGLIWGAVRDGAEAIQPKEVVVIQCDARVHRVDRYQGAELPENLDAVGRGGTSFRPVFEWIANELDAPPACLIYMTDLMGSFPDDEPDYETLWIVTSSYGSDPPFGERIDFDEEVA